MGSRQVSWVYVTSGLERQEEDGTFLVVPPNNDTKLALNNDNSNIDDITSHC